jgi:hypothetical protein
MVHEAIYRSDRLMNQAGDSGYSRQLTAALMAYPVSDGYPASQINPSWKALQAKVSDKFSEDVSLLELKPTPFESNMVGYNSGPYLILGPYTFAGKFGNGTCQRFWTRDAKV